MAWDWVGKLLGSPMDFREGWLEAANGGLWELCQAAANDDPTARNCLNKLAAILETKSETVRERLEWLLGQVGISPSHAQSLLAQMHRLTDAFVRHNGSTFARYLKGCQRRVSLQALGVHRNSGFVARVVLEEWEQRDNEPMLLPHPQSCLLPQDEEFRSALQTVQQWWQATEWGKQPLHLTWRIARIDGEPLEALKGNSLSALLAAGIALLCMGVPADETITISAALTKDGRLLPVGGIEEKARQRHRADPPLRHLLLAADQPTPEGDTFPSDFFQHLSTLADAVDFFLNRARPFQAVREDTKRQVSELRFFDRTVSWSVYVEPTLRLPEKSERVELWAWFSEQLRSGQRVQCLLTAPSGLGKTTALRFLAHRLSNDPAWCSFLPVLLTADQWSNLFFGRPQKALPAILERLYQPQVQLAPTHDHWRSWLRQGRIVLLVDQAEQVANQWNFRDHLRAVLEEFERLSIVIAVRSEWVERFQDLPLPLVRLEPLSEAKARRLCERLAQAMQRPMPPSLPPLGGSPLLLVAAMCCPDVRASGQGQLLLQLAEWLLPRYGSWSLPPNLVLSVLAETVWLLPDEPAWRQDRFYEALQEAVTKEGLRGETASRLWQALTQCPLLSFYDSTVSFSHTLLAEVMRACAFAKRCSDGALPPEVRQRLTPLRATLLASLLPDNAIPAFWEWLQQRVESDPAQWAEGAAQCLHERTDAPERFVPTLLSHWFTAFEKGAPAQEHWDRTVSALPVPLLQQYALPKIRQWLLSATTFVDNRAAVRLMSLVVDKVPLTSVLPLLVNTFLENRYRVTLLPDLKVVLESEAQREFTNQFFRQLLAKLEAPRLTTRRATAEALAQLVAHPVKVPQELCAEVEAALQRCLREPSFAYLQSILRRALHQLHSLGS